MPALRDAVGLHAMDPAHRGCDSEAAQDAADPLDVDALHHGRQILAYVVAQDVDLVGVQLRDEALWVVCCGLWAFLPASPGGVGFPLFVLGEVVPS